MDFSLKCNSLKCRSQLLERAIVTTCSHIFCEACSESLGLLSRSNVHKTCPACQTTLTNPDDAVSSQLNPTEDYKTSVLSGLNPATIIECAGRGLAFWSYQCTQEIVYQEYLAKTLTDKYQTLNVQVDKIVNEANSEIESLHQRINQLQIDQDKLKADNATLAGALREKARKYQQVQELYDKQKRKEMTAATRSAAFDSADEVLQAAAYDRRSNSDDFNYGAYGTDNDVSRDRGLHGRFHQEGNSSSDRGHSMMPPPLQRPVQGGPNRGSRLQTEVIETPQHRIRLGGALGVPQQATGSNRFSKSFPGGVSNQPRSIRRPPSNVTGFNGGPSSRFGTGFGLSAGMKRGTHHTLDGYRSFS